MAAIEIRDLVKTYGDVTAVDHVDLTVESGEVFALLGPNGAGKTTTVEIMEGHRTATSGQVSVLGMDPETGGRDYRERIGIVLQQTTVEQELTVTEALDTYGSIYSRRRATGELIALVGLEEKASARIKSLSGGQQRRLELALGLVGDPDLLFLDEPTTGFDPSARRQAWVIVENLASLGKTILLTTHYMDEAQHLADRIAVIADGRIVASGTPSTLGGRSEAESVIRFGPTDGLPLGELGIEAGPDGRVEVRTKTPTALVHRITAAAVERGIEIEDLVVERPTLEDVYLSLTGDE